MKAVRKKPGEPPEIVDLDNTLEALQKEVDGYIESFQIASDCTIICNEEGKLLPLEPNLLFCGEAFFGTVLAVGVRGESFCSLRPQAADAFIKWWGMKEAWLTDGSERKSGCREKSCGKTVSLL